MQDFYLYCSSAPANVQMIHNNLSQRQKQDLMKVLRKLQKYNNEVQRALYKANVVVIQPEELWCCN